ncbi:MAG TPA: L,D-transpeptidase [Polyangiaceae bacterium]|nr:L,D-transpeptidase [Polyangiaceae bacterium]
MGPRLMPPAPARRSGRAPLALAALASLALALSCADEGLGPRGGVRPPPPKRPVAAAPLAPKPAPAAPRPAAPPAPTAVASAAAPEPAPAPAPAPPPPPRLLALRKEVSVYAAPDARSPKLGYLRAGAMAERSKAPVGRKGCSGGWYAVEPRGYVCAGPAASIDLEGPIAELSRRRPERAEGLPYDYVLTTSPAPPFYLRLPSAAEQRSIEGEIAAPRESRVALASVKPAAGAEASLKGGGGVSALKGGAGAAAGAEPSPVPEALRDGAVVPSLSPNHYGPGALYEGRALPRTGLALLERFDWQGRAFGLTTDLLLVPLDRTRPVRPSAFHGLELGGESFAAFVVAKGGDRLYRREGGRLVADAPLAYREGVALSGRSEREGGATYLETADGRFVRDGAHLRRADPPAAWPAFALEGKKWVDVSIVRQTLVAYEGTKPAFATLVSTGADGLGDPEETHSTVRGTFAIRAKHVTATMDSDELEDRFDLRDVPYVQYFHGGYALHAAYWHDGFGAPRSHGCINLHPTDASWLFRWTDPPVPDDWHGALGGPEGGTLVHVRP